MSGDDFQIFNTFLKSVDFTVQGPNVLGLNFIKTNYTSNSLYEFTVQNNLNCKLLSYNDVQIKSNYATNPLVIRLLENPLYILMFTNVYFSFSNKLNPDVFDYIEFYSDNIKKLLQSNQIMNLQESKQVFDLTAVDINYISQNLQNVNYQTIVEDLFQNNLYTYSLVASFFGIKINYWRLSGGNTKVEHVPLPVNTYLLNKMKIVNPPEYNLFDIFYLNNAGKPSFYSFYLTFQIPPEVRKYYLECQ